MTLYKRWTKATSQAEQEEIWSRILDIHAEQVYTIGLVAQVPQPVLVTDGLMNVPDDAIFNWDPGAQFGIYRPDSFYWAK